MSDNLVTMKIGKEVHKDVKRLSVELELKLEDVIALGIECLKRERERKDPENKVKD